MSRTGRPPERILKDPRKRQAWVIYQISLQGRSLAELARGAGVRRQTLYQAFHRHYPRMERIIAEAVGLEPKTLWPERYDADGQPAKRRGRPRKSTVMTRKNNTTE
ncbi:MAG TPA: nucleotide excision repair protein [Chromatiales bacterium]|nr:nucleotide excision repair protein [Chromatiales bacterium]